MKGASCGRWIKEDRRPVDSNGSTTDRDNLWCTFCKKPRHTVDKCWKLHGKPVRGGQQPQSKPKGQSYMANSQLGSGVINSRQQVEGKDIEQAEFMGLK